MMDKEHLRTIILCFLGCFIASIFYIFGVFFKYFELELGLTRATTSLAFFFMSITYASLNTPMGFWYERYGPRKIVSFAGIIAVIGLILCSQISSVPDLFLSFGLLGIGLSPMYVFSAAIVNEWFIARRGFVLGVVASGFGIGMSVLSPMLSSIILSYGWRNALLILGLIYGFISGMISYLIRKSPKELGCKPYGETSEMATKDKVNMRNEKKIGGVTLKYAIRTFQFWGLFFVSVSGLAASFMVLVHLVPFVTDAGIPLQIAATVLGSTGVFNIIGRIAGGFVSDKIGRIRTFMILLTIQALSILWLIKCNTVWMFFVFASIFGFSYGWLALFPAIVGEWFGLTHMASIFGAINGMLIIGAMTSPVAAGYIFDISGSYLPAFLVGAMLCIIAALFLLFLKEPS